MNNVKKYYDYGYGDAGVNIENKNVGNREIGEWYGFVQKDITPDNLKRIGFKMYQWELDLDDPLYSQYHASADLLFDKDWVLLMAVVEKIGQIDTEWIKEHDTPDSPVRKLFEMSIFTPINELYEAVHQFITWYKSQPTHHESFTKK